MADSDNPAEACGFCSVVRDEQPHLDSHIRADERARVLAEVDAALRDDERVTMWLAWAPVNDNQTECAAAADYLRDVFGAGGGVAQEGTVKGPENHGEPRTGPPDTEAHGAPEAGGTA